MEIKTFYFNPYRECTYIIPKDGHCIIIDPGMYNDKEQQRLMDYLTENNLLPTLVLITHAHPDHICGLDFVKQQFPDAIIYDYSSYVPSATNPIPWEGTYIKVIATPGHKEDALCYYFEEEKTIFTGDTLFQESIGRTDLPGGDMSALCRSLSILKQLPNEVQVYPGHGYPTSIQHEKDYNPFM